MKQCSSCLTTKELKYFASDDRKKDRLQSHCRECQNTARKVKYMNDSEWRETVIEKAKKWYKANPETVKNGDLKREYGITLEQYNQLIKQQNGVCAICGKSETGKALSIDHDHNTGKIRGLLCQAHNRALGMFHDNLEELKSAIKYLESNV
jgi:hypothetical protein